MLKQRVITALLMLAILLPAVFYPNPAVFSAVSLILIVAGAWEWGRLNQYGQSSSIAAATLCALVCLLVWYGGLLQRPMKELWLLSGSGWVLLGAWLLSGGVKAWSSVPQAVRLAGGMCALVVAWMAVAQARMVGINFLFSVLVLVWVADVFAYFFGRAFGGRLFNRKLAPSISPGKTWEGAFGGLFGVVGCALVWRIMDSRVSLAVPSLYSRLSEVHWGFMVLAVLFLASMSVVGDLVESLFKRSAGVKDSSGLLPGHGGVLDRVDALLPILPLAMMFASL